MEFRPTAKTGLFPESCTAVLGGFVALREYLVRLAGAFSRPRRFGLSVIDRQRRHRFSRRRPDRTTGEKLAKEMTPSNLTRSHRRLRKARGAEIDGHSPQKKTESDTAKPPSLSPNGEEASEGNAGRRCRDTRAFQGDATGSVQADG